MRASERVYATLLHEIQLGHLPPGAVLAETEQAARLGVSRTPVRTALNRLAQNGFTTHPSPRVTVVSDFDRDDIIALFQVRRALEENGAKLAAASDHRSTFAQLASAFCAADPGSDAAAIEAYYKLIARFDDALDLAIDNSYFTAMHHTVRTHLARARRLARDNQQRLHASAAEHQLIASAIAAGDGELAAHATHVHLHLAEKAILAALQPIHPTPLRD